MNCKQMKRYYSDIIYLNDNKITISKSNNKLLIKSNNKSILSLPLTDIINEYGKYVNNILFLISEREEDNIIQNIYINFIIDNKSINKDEYNYKKLEIKL